MSTPQTIWHSDLANLAGSNDDHTQYLLAVGTRALSADWDARSFEIRAQTFESDVATGTAPLIVASTTKVTNLNADLLDDQSGAYYLDSIQQLRAQPPPLALRLELPRLGETTFAQVPHPALARPDASDFLDDERFRERFLREDELGRTLHHPNIIRIFERGQVGNTPYFVMELIRGETLRVRLDRDGRLDATLAVRVAAQVAEALGYAHHKGVIHRDLKPSNIMLERAGGVRVMHYGLARARQLEGLTTTGAFLGTPSYAAPEAVDAACQPQSDVYSISTGRPRRSPNPLRQSACVPPAKPRSKAFASITGQVTRTKMTTATIPLVSASTTSVSN